MTSKRVSLFLSAIALISVNALEPPEVSSAMESNDIVPDIIDVAPKNLVEVTYPSGAKANLGNELTPTEVKDIPHVFWEADDNELYTLLLTDPDAPSRKTPMVREVRHWLVVNIPGNKISEGQTIYEYIGSGPPKDTGLHRYVFLVFKQFGRILTDTFVSNRTRQGRLATSTRDLISDYGLGNPIAGNFYQAQYDDYVPILQEQLGGAPPKT